jgi:Ca2+-binding RTX toxin-like protein
MVSRMGTRGPSKRIATGAGLGVLLICSAAALMLSVGASANSDVYIQHGGTEIYVDGEQLPGETNQITIREKSNPRTGPFYEIHDPQGVNNVPPGCSREDAFTIRCPTQGVTSLVVLGGPGDDTITLDITSAVNTEILAYGGNDTLFGTPGDDTQDGGPGNDELLGEAGDDTQIGGPGNDEQTGDSGNDTQLGGPGNDTQKGGKGSDTQNCGGGKNDKGVGGGGNDKSKGCETGKP